MSLFGVVYFGFVVLQLFSFSFGNPLCSSHDSLALLQFKKSLAVDFSSSYYFDVLCPHSFLPKTVSWNGSRDCCRWDGVTCDSFTGHVIGLDLRCSQLVGSLHPNSTLFHLRHLQTLDLSCNNFQGSIIPRGTVQLVRLKHLNLSYSFLRGRIPSEISHLSKLVSLDLSSTYGLQLSQNGLRKLFQNMTKLELLSLPGVDISSKMPINISSSLRYLDLRETNLQGNLPNSIFFLPYLETLKLSFNTNLNVSLPKFNWTSSHILIELDLSYTHVSGVLPDSLGSLKALQIVQFSSCKLVGPIPESISNLSQITFFDLSSNRLESKIPDAFSNMQKLTLLSLEDNTFSGQFPSSLVNLTKLEVLRLTYNSLSGPLPLTANGLQNLKGLHLYDNSFNGSIPPWLFSLPSLTLLSLDRNHFSGPLPEFKTNSLQQLHLSDNSLNGSILPSMFSLPSMTELSLGNNHFSGPLPEFKTNSLEWLDLSQNQLNGFIPQTLHNLVNLTHLSLASNDLSGEFGAEMFSSMPNLGYLDLSHSGLSWSSKKGNINITVPLTVLGLGFCRVKDFPNISTSSKRLEYLDLSENEIQGMFPKWIGGFSSLQVLNLSHNYLTSLDNLPLQTIGVVDLQSNSLRGPFPSSLCRPNELRFLDLSNNNLSSEIPNCFISYSLVVLDLRGNNFHGPIPNIFSGRTEPFFAQSWSELHFLGLGKNQLEGPIPRSLINCRSLQVLDLGNNKINDTFPTWLETLQMLEVLILKSNRFYGPIGFLRKESPLPLTTFYEPIDFLGKESRFPKLRIFELSDNLFSGFLPTKVLKGFLAMMNGDAHGSKPEYMAEEYYSNYTGKYDDSVAVVMKNQEFELKRILKIFTTIDLSRNRFEGEIPKFIGKLNSLVLLNLSHNNLTGHIPVELKNMSALEALDLSFNQLTGKIPQELVSLTFLAVLNLSHNNLVGPIPHQNQFSTFSNDSYFGNRGLCGLPLSKECGDKRAPPVSLAEQEKESSFLSEFTWSSVVIGYGCGLIFGFTIYYLIYRFERPRWFINFFASITPEKESYRAKRGGQRRRNICRRR